VVFKAVVGAVPDAACLVLGVGVPPARRGRGLSVPGLAAVVVLAVRAGAPVDSLYVTDYNEAARAAYRRVGFTDRGTFMSVLF
jgi:predicted GNAT family acetyltransferase